MPPQGDPSSSLEEITNRLARSGGLDVVKAVQDYVLPDLSTVNEAGRIHQEKVDRGELGVKAGRGFLEWTPRKAEEVRARRDAFLIQFLRWQKAGKFS
jgi:3-hydroxybutyryl-CoA dehydrogenase